MSFTATIKREQTISLLDCAVCEGPVALLPEHEKVLRRDGGAFYCAHGHSNVFRPTEIDRLRDKLNEQTREATKQAERARQAQLDAAQARAGWEEAEKARTKAEQEAKAMKRRAAAAVCPCCHRSFAVLGAALKRHIATKHPEFQA